MNDLFRRFAMLVSAASLATLPLRADEVPDPGGQAPPTMEDVLALQARLEELKSSDLPDDQKIAEILELKKSIRHKLRRLRALEPKEPNEEAEPAPDPSDPSDLYFSGWLLSRDAAKLDEAEKPAEAIEKLELARQLFDRVARDFPDWKKEMVKGRRAQTAESLARLSKQIPAPEQK